MKWSEILAKLGIKLDDEVDMTDETAVDEKTKEDKVVDDKGTKETDTTDKTDVADKKDSTNSTDKIDNTVVDKKEEEDVKGGNNMEPVVDAGWFDPNTLAIDETKIHNEEVLNAVKALKANSDNIIKQQKIDSSLAEAMKGLELNITEATFKKNLDLSKVQILKDGTVKGVAEAIEGLKTAEPGFFKIDGAGDKKESNPLKEGLNPATSTNKTTDGQVSFAAAMASRAEQ